jgi:outer membrane protein TolC
MLFFNKIKYNISILLLLSTSLIAQDISFTEALNIMRRTNKTLSSAQNEEVRFNYERKAARGLFFPRLDANASFTEMDDKIIIDLNDIRSAMLFLHSDNPVANMLPSFETQVQNKGFWKLNATLTWPIFTGGKILAANNAAEARLNESQEKTKQVEDRLISELVSRYFGLRLAKSVVDIRKQVLDAMDQHLYEAKKLEEEGMIAKAERLHAEVFHSEAEREYKNAKRNMGMARAALNNTLSDDVDFEPISPLFIFKEIEPLSYYQQAAAEHNPILKQVDSKRELAHQGYKKEIAEFLPQVYLFGKKEIYTKDLTLLEPDWAVGVGLKINIFEGLAKYNRLKASEYLENQVSDLYTKAQRDILTLVEKRYNELMDALEQYESTDAALEFAQEYVRVRTRAFEEGLSTSVEVVDAQLALSRVKIERLTALYNFDVSLANLLEASGQNNEFEVYFNRSDVEVESGSKK